MGASKLRELVRLPAVDFRQAFSFFPSPHWCSSAAERTIVRLRKSIAQKEKRLEKRKLETK
jgi:hypothetical protein